jgi:predicted enzyme related to lactoylglutathione lyase
MGSANGWPVWYELMSPDPAGSIPFYRAVLGWEIAPEGAVMPNGSEYRMIGRADGGHAGGVLTLTPGMREMGMAPGWFTYFNAGDVDALAAKIEELGGAVHLQPTDMGTAGRIAMASDPFGAMFYLIKPTPPASQPDAQSDVFAPGVVGRNAWNELGTTDGPGAVEFYKALFDWKSEDFMSMGPAGEYRFIEMDGTQVGAISPMLAEGSKPGWLPYFRAENIDTAKQAVLANGGTLIMDAHEVPGDDMIVIVSDPAGAQLGIAARKKEA